eukprot:m.1287396 g.1287396  ORF g.1287396 m.1287396 type:complete len:260 (+) comp24781_c0_seq17:1467-2246(+)
MHISCRYYDITSDELSSKVAGWACIICVFLFVSGFAMSWGPVVWLIPTEIFPTSQRARGVSLSTAANWTWGIIVGQFVPRLQTLLNFKLYFAFAGFGFVMSWFVYLANSFPPHCILVCGRLVGWLLAVCVCVCECVRLCCSLCERFVLPASCCVGDTCPVYCTITHNHRISSTPTSNLAIPKYHRMLHLGANMGGGSIQFIASVESVALSVGSSTGRVDAGRLESVSKYRSAGLWDNVVMRAVHLRAGEEPGRNRLGTG